MKNYVGTGDILVLTAPAPLFDRRRSLVALTDAGGQMLEYYRYAAFGEPAILAPDGTARVTSAHDMVPLFAGQHFLPAAGLYLSRSRLMMPRQGIFLSPDPLAYANSPSLYVYAAQNPVDLIDPDGEFAFLAVLAVMAVGALIGGSVNAVRQGIQMAEDPAKAREGFSFGELFQSIGLGAVLAPIVVFAPEVGIPLMGIGFASGVEQISKGNYATGTFDIVTSLLPLGSKGARGSMFGRGSYVGQARGFGPAASVPVRAARFNVSPLPFGGRKLGVSYAGDDRGGHVAIFAEGENGTFTLFEKNAQRTPDGRLVAAFNTEETLPTEYFNGRQLVPFQHETVRVPALVADEAVAYASSRMKTRPFEPFDKKSANCSHFAADALAEAGFGQLNPTGSGRGLWTNFLDIRQPVTSMPYAAPFWAKLPPPSRLSK